jgi:hypothetical protein
VKGGERQWHKHYLEVTKLRFVFEAGMDDEGNPILKAKTFSNVTKAATADQLSPVHRESSPGFL